MTTFQDRPGTALLILDTQNGVVDGNHQRDAVIANMVPELAPGDTEPVLDKSYADAFEDTTLETVLAGLGAGRLIVAGAQTDECIRSTLHGAIVRGYDAILVSDAHTTEDQTEWGAPPPDQVIAHTNLYWTYHRAPGRTAGTVETRNVDFARPAES
jgi:nicotinamidase-related amidase